MKIPQGFSLIEIAVVLFIIGLLMSGLLVPLSIQIDQNRIKATQRDLETIKEALLGFAIVNKRLPYPADAVKNDGIENLNTCEDEGDLPWATLGLDNRYDVWGHPFRYRVEEDFCNEIIYPTPVANLIVKNRQGEFLSNQNNSNIVAIIFSYSKDGQPNGENRIKDDVYTQDMYIENSFDDILVWLPKMILINKLVSSGQWP